MTKLSTKHIVGSLTNILWTGLGVILMGLTLYFQKEIETNTGAPFYYSILVSTVLPFFIGKVKEKQNKPDEYKLKE